MKRLEAATLVVGVVLLVVALLAVDWRLSFALLGVLLILSALDLRPRRRT